MLPSGQLSWWTKERIAELKARWRDNQTGKQICDAMHAASRNAVIGKAHRLKLPARVGGDNNTAKSSTFRRSRKIKARTVHKPMEKPVDKLWTAMWTISETFKNPKRLLDLTHNDCHWPGSGEVSVDLLYCAAPVFAGRSYCMHHCQVAFVKAPKRLSRP